MNRYPTKDVIKILRAECGFKCSIPNCDVPFLTYHHFAPSWSVQKHHNPEGMLALCSIHHDQADGGAWSEDQLRIFKTNLPVDSSVSGMFNYLRHSFLLEAGGNFYYNNIQAEIALFGHPIIWFERDEFGYKLLNIILFDEKGHIYFHMENNSWRVSENIKDIECPPRGRKLIIHFINGNHVKIEFKEIRTSEEFIKNIGKTNHSYLLDYFPLPVTLLKISLKLTEFNIDFKPSKMLVGNNVYSGCFSHDNNIGMSF